MPVESSQQINLHEHRGTFSQQHWINHHVMVMSHLLLLPMLAGKESTEVCQPLLVAPIRHQLFHINVRVLPGIV